MLQLKIAISPYFTELTMFRDKAIFHKVSVATLLTYKDNRVLLEGLSIKIENTLDKNAGRADTVTMLYEPNTFLKHNQYLHCTHLTKILQTLKYIET